jgi:serine/threonine protein kinase
MTSPGQAVGTVSYMSPEQVRARELDARTDLFSFGAVLYEMATGQLPFRGESSGVIFKAILDSTPTAAVRLNPDIPTKLEEIINKALEKNRNLRYQHATEMRADLQRLKRDYESGKAGSTTPQRSPSVWPPQVAGDQPSSASADVSALARRHRNALVLAAFGLLALLAGLGYGLYRFGTRHAPPKRSTFEAMKITRITAMASRASL